MAILGELDRAGLLDTSVHRIDYPDLKSAIAANDILSATASEEAKARALAAPGGKFNLELGSQDNTYPEADTDRKQGCIRDMEHPYLKDGGLAVLFGNLAEDGRRRRIDPPFRGQSPRIRITGRSMRRNPLRQG